ncbi:MAG TPA: 4Fe-4S dicluster domain-containing protein [candidate division Zixibacteria bacterium]|nr:4Fe-4S dicluster domain-containing protein [candidate division Zixibacteria bacterium]MDM7973286.1 4Fe-4S dicluster domain-containing protein [candidate division Zixibacteria bacterium]HOZ08381.1 4Fe-4S dicluster domain-containing protein [candidate division Zixibacteria bacterium]HPM38287.1 4Fe-4S dicluster domain-containing protein [candidate division Zixibacteria bacterium]
MSMNRRAFLGVAATGSAALLLGRQPASADTIESADFSNSRGVLVDTVACIGCRKCEAACNEANRLTSRSAETFEDKTVLEQHRRPDARAFTVINRFSDPARPAEPYTMKVQCMHCNRPACVSACIVGALRKTPEGPVIYDAWKCIGCRYCMVACPFQIPAYEYEKALDPQVRKCTFCYERITAEGKLPACVEICPNEALTYGRRDELIALARTRIKAYPDRYVNHVYGEFEAGGTSWLYLSPTDFASTELPRLSHDPIPERTEKIQHGIFKSFVPPLALYGLLGLIMHSLRNGRSSQADREVKS